MLTPSVLGSAGPAAHSNHVIGALIVTFAVMAVADVGRDMGFVPKREVREAGLRP